MRPVRVYKKSKKTTVQLTSLLDLLFVMIFVSLIQQKEIVPSKKPIPEKKPKPVAAKPVVKPKPKKPTPRPVLKTYPVSAVFKFYGTPGNPNIPGGEYMMQGSFDEKTRDLKLGGVNWLNRPPGYDMVPLTGKIEKTHTLFKGKVDFPGCKLFTLTRKETFSHSPISGVWEGIYDCSQGPTGLTLTIQ